MSSSLRHHRKPHKNKCRIYILLVAWKIGVGAIISNKFLTIDEKSYSIIFRIAKIPRKNSVLGDNFVHMKK